MDEAARYPRAVRLAGVIVDRAEPGHSEGGRRPVALVGLPGSGKTRVGALLASGLGRDFLDTDCLIETREGRTVAELVAEKGWVDFRRSESRALAEAMGRGNAVIAGGGGIVESQANRDLLKRATVVWLEASLPILLARLEADATRRPLLEQEAGSRLAELARLRDPLYAELAGYRIATDHSSPEQVSEAIMRMIETGNG